MTTERRPMSDERLEELRQIAGGIDAPKSDWIDELIDEVDRLKAIVSKLPWCWDLRDGEWVQVPVAPGMTVWVVADPLSSGTVVRVERRGFEVQRPKSIVWVVSGAPYASKAAVEAALRGERPEGRDDAE